MPRTLSTPKDRARASRLRRRDERGRRPLNQAERAWLDAYEAAHPHGSRPLADIEAEDARAPYEAPAVESSEDVEGEDEAAPDALVGAGEAPRARAASIEVELRSQGAELLVRAVELHERVSVRALALVEQIADMHAENSAQLNDALIAVANARAESIIAEASGSVEDDEGDPAQASRIEGLLLQVLGPEVRQRLAAHVAQASAPRPPGPPRAPSARRTP